MGYLYLKMRQKMKYKNKNDFAEKVINKIPFVQNLNIKIIVDEYSTSFKPLKGDSFFGGHEITTSFMDKLSGIIDGLKYAYDELKGAKHKNG